MAENEYSPLARIKEARKAMDHYVQKHTPSQEKPLTLSTNEQPIPCAVLLKSFTDGGPVPDDFKALPKTSTALKAHVRPDGGVYKGAFDLEGGKDSVVLMYGPKNLTPQRAERIAAMERLALTKRHQSFTLGQFAAQPPTPPRAS